MGGSPLDSIVPRDAVEELAGQLSAEAWSGLQLYVDMLLDASARMNLVSHRDRERLGEHVVDAAALLSVIDIEGLRVCDLGSGAGLPGVVLAILRPGSHVTAVEARRRRSAFLKSVVRRLKLGNVAVLNCRMEELEKDQTFDLVTARALGSVEDVLAPALHTVGCGGRLVLFKGPKWSDEREIAASIASDEGFKIGWERGVVLPGIGRTTRFVEFHVEQESVED